MVKKARRYENLLLLVIPLVFIFDQFVKFYSEEGCFLAFCIDRTFNDGAAFGILPGQSLLLIFVGLIVLLLIASIYRKSSREIKIALVLIAAGTISNMFDRVVFGGVIDVLSVFGSSSFNIADLSNLFGGVILIKLLINDYFKGRRKKRR